MAQDHIVDAMISAVSRLPGSVVVAVLLFIYPGVGLALPLLLAWPPLALTIANILSVVVAGDIVLFWLGPHIEAVKRRHLLEWTTDLRNLNSQEFEWLVGEIYRREGWEVTEKGRQDGPDGNVDLELRDVGGKRVVVQCKRWQSWRVGVDEIRKFAGTLFREDLRQGAGIFVTLSEFTEDARHEAKTSGIRLVDGADLYTRMEKARRPEPCPVCEAPMILDRSSHGWWFRCVANCPGKRHLGAEPVRALEFLTRT